MTLTDLQFNIDKINHSKESRANAVSLIVDNFEVLPELIDKAFTKDKNHFKYCWWLEFLNRQHIEVLCPHLKVILERAQELTHQSAIRPIAKIIETLVLNYYSKKPNDIVVEVVNHEIKELMVTRTFEWLIDNQLKVAPRAYSMTSLYHLGKDIDWVHEELKLVIDQNYTHESVAYQARARMILKKLN